MPAPRRRPRVAGRSHAGGARATGRPGRITPSGQAGQRALPPEQAAQDRDERQPDTPRQQEPAEPVTVAELPEELATAADLARGEGAGSPEPGPLPRSRHRQADRQRAVERDRAAAAAANTEAVTTQREPARSRSMLLPVTLLAVGVLLAAFAVFAGLRWQQAGSGGDNMALTDADTTHQVQTAVSTALNTLLSFDYQHPGKNDKAAKRFIAGTLGDCGGSTKVGYDKLMGVLQKQGPKQQLTLRSTVVRSGVQRLQESSQPWRARLLVLLSQRYSKGTGKNAQQSSALAAATVDAVRQGGSWKLTQLCLQ